MRQEIIHLFPFCLLSSLSLMEGVVSVNIRIGTSGNVFDITNIKIRVHNSSFILQVVVW